MIRSASPTASVLTIGNEIVCGDVPNTNAVWLARRLATLGVRVRVAAAVADEAHVVAALVRSEAPQVDFLVITGGLGGTPDDLTREAVAVAFGVPQVEEPALAAELRDRFAHEADYAVRWARLPQGSRVLPNPLGGIPGFVIGNVYVLPGAPAEMKGIFMAFEEQFRRGGPIGSWRQMYTTRESVIVSALTEVERRWPTVRVGSYPFFDHALPEVEVVLKSGDAGELAVAARWLSQRIDEILLRASFE